MANELREALLAANVPQLIQKRIDPLLLEYQRRYSPLVRVVPTIPWNSTQYFFNTRTARGSGGFVTDGGARPVSNSTYSQSSFTIRLMQTIGAVTGFSQTVTRDLVGDLKAQEMDGSYQSLIWDLENAMIWGNDPATSTPTNTSSVPNPYPQFSGLDYLVSTFSGNGQNSIDVNGAITLANIDQLIDLVEQNASMPIGSNFMLVASNTLVSKLAQLQVANQRFVGQVEVATGLIVLTYRDVPLVKSSFLGPRGFVINTPTPTTSTTLGTLAAATYFYRIGAVIARMGETIASTEVSQVTTGATSTVTLTFTVPTGNDGAGPLLYKVYRSTGAGTETLIGVVDAVLVDTNGNTVNVTAIKDTGTSLVTTGPSATQQDPGVYFSANAGAKPRAATQEDIYLVPNDKNFLLRPATRNFQPIPLAATKTSPDELPYAIVADTCLAVRAPKYVGRLARCTVAL